MTGPAVLSIINGIPKGFPKAATSPIGKTSKLGFGKVSP